MSQLLNHTDAVRSKLDQSAATGIRASLGGVLVSVLLGAVKILAGVLGHSYALIADGVESMLDVVSGLVVAGSLKIAVQPPDERYPFGYGKIEPVAALVIAAEKDARDLGPLLGQLATCARDEAKMRTRIWIDRAKTRTSVKVIAGCVLLFAGGLLVFSRAYLEPYDTAVGQVVLLVIGAAFAVSLIAMDRMARIEVPERFVARRPA